MQNLNTLNELKKQIKRAFLKELLIEKSKGGLTQERAKSSTRLVLRVLDRSRSLPELHQNVHNLILSHKEVLFERAFTPIIKELNTVLVKSLVEKLSQFNTSQSSVMPNLKVLYYLLQEATDSNM